MIMMLIIILLVGILYIHMHKHTHMYIHGIFKKISTYNIESGYGNNAIDKCSSEIAYIKLHSKCKDQSNQLYAVFSSLIDLIWNTSFCNVPPAINWNWYISVSWTLSLVGALQKSSIFVERFKHQKTQVRFQFLFLLAVNSRKSLPSLQVKSIISGRIL